MTRTSLTLLLAATLASTIGCSSKNYVRQQTTPLINKTNELDDLTAKNSRDIKDVDQRAQAGIQSVTAKAGEADKKAMAAGQQADQAQQLANNATTRVDTSCLEWLAELVDGALSERAEGLEFILDREQVSARAEHLREWPQDLAGAETAAALAADDESARRAGLVYLEVLEWAIGLLDRRLAEEPRPRRSRLRLLGHRPAETEVELPMLVEESLAGSPRYGWPGRPGERPQAA